MLSLSSFSITGPEYGVGQCSRAQQQCWENLQPGAPERHNSEGEIAARELRVKQCTWAWEETGWRAAPSHAVQPGGTQYNGGGGGCPGMQCRKTTCNMRTQKPMALNGMAPASVAFICLEVGQPCSTLFILDAMISIHKDHRLSVCSF